MSDSPTKPSRPTSSARPSGLPLVTMVLVAAAALFWLGYHVGRHDVSTTTRTVEKQWIIQQEELTSLRKAVAARQEQLAMLVGELQARMVRLESIGQRLLAMSDTDTEEFDLDAPPALGGPMAQRLDDTLDLAAELDLLATQLQNRYEQWRVLLGLALTSRMDAKSRPAGRPIDDGWITSRYGRRKDPFTGESEFHRGVDFATSEGAPIYAVASGIVTQATYQPGYGNLVEIRHADDYSTRYAHCQRLLVTTGDTVAQGQVIATVGQSGRATGPHVHFEVHRHGRHVDPLRFTQVTN